VRQSSRGEARVPGPARLRGGAFRDLFSPASERTPNPQGALCETAQPKRSRPCFPRPARTNCSGMSRDSVTEPERCWSVWRRTC